MIRQARRVMVALLVVAGMSAHAEETGTVIDTFACTFKEGRGVQDLRAAVDFWTEQVDALDSRALDSYFAAILTPYRATTGRDFFWVGASPNLNSLAAGGYDYLTSAQGQAADARFDSIADCESSVYLAEQIFDALPEEGDDDVNVLAEVYGCTFNEGTTLADANKAEKNWTSVAAAHGAKVDVHRWVPLYANTPVDAWYLILSDGLREFGDYRTKWITSKDGQDADERFNRIMNCESGLMIGTRIRAPKTASE